MVKKLEHVGAFNRLQELSRIKISKRGAAKILWQEGFFNNTEQARSFIRQKTGANGEFSNNSINWLTDIPTPLESEFRVKELPKNLNGIGLLSDIHIPFQDRKTIESFLEREDEYDAIVFWVTCLTFTPYQGSQSIRP